MAYKKLNDEISKKLFDEFNELKRYINHKKAIKMMIKRHPEISDYTLRYKFKNPKRIKDNRKNNTRPSIYTEFDLVFCNVIKSELKGKNKSNFKIKDIFEIIAPKV